MSASTPSTAPEAGPAVTVVAVGLLQRSDGCVLVAERPAHLAHGGCWEFPGGKVEPGETLFQALARELREEIAIDVLAARPWRSVPWVYPKGPVRLEVWRVERWQGTARGLEGQAVAWQPVEYLPQLPFPAANRSIVNALRLPDRLLVTPEPPSPGDHAGNRRWISRLDAALASGIRLLQFRAKSLLESLPHAWRALGREVVERARASGALVLANASPEEALGIGADGVHLASRQLTSLRERPVGEDVWCAASCHDAAQLIHAREVGVDFTVLGPVQPTATHPGAPALGWAATRRLVAGAALPVYLVGGLGRGDQSRAAGIGAQGIAAIRAHWEDRDTGARAGASSALHHLGPWSTREE